jgi:hypothetical protein
MNSAQVYSRCVVFFYRPVTVRLPVKYQIFTKDDVRINYPQITDFFSPNPLKRIIRVVSTVIITRRICILYITSY